MQLIAQVANTSNPAPQGNTRPSSHVEARNTGIPAPSKPMVHGPQPLLKNQLNSPWTSCCKKRQMRFIWGKPLLQENRLENEGPASIYSKRGVKQTEAGCKPTLGRSLEFGNSLCRFPKHSIRSPVKCPWSLQLGLIHIQHCHGNSNSIQLGLHGARAEPLWL